MRITAIREITLPIGSGIRNAYIDFLRMTISLVAVITDVICDSRTVIGYGFKSNVRYGQGGLIRDCLCSALTRRRRPFARERHSR
jgi:Mn2+/Fe2+ NRAMP family transporter